MSPRQATTPVNSGLVRSEQRRAHRRADAVGADRERAFDGFTVLERHRDAAVALRQRRKTAAEPDRIGPLAADRIGEGGVQVAAVHEDVRRAVALLRHR